MLSQRDSTCDVLCQLKSCQLMHTMNNRNILQGLVHDLEVHPRYRHCHYSVGLISLPIHAPVRISIDLHPKYEEEDTTEDRVCGVCLLRLSHTLHTRKELLKKVRHRCGPRTELKQCSLTIGFYSIWIFFMRFYTLFHASLYIFVMRFHTL